MQTPSHITAPPRIVVASIQPRFTRQIMKEKYTIIGAPHTHTHTHVEQSAGPAEAPLYRVELTTLIALHFGVPAIAGVV